MFIAFIERGRGRERERQTDRQRETETDREGETLISSLPYVPRLGTDWELTGN